MRFWQLNAVPPGLHYDIAANAILTREIAFGGYRPVFIEAYTGKEALFFYWAALWARLVGPGVFSLRLAAAMLGVLAVPVSYFAARQLFPRERGSRWQALLTAAILGLSFVHLVWSRFGLRAISEPVLQGLALGFLWRGLRRAAGSRQPGPGAPGDMALAGLFTGLTAYTYLAARLFPLPLAAGLLAHLYFSRSTPHASRSLLLPLLSYLLTALLTFLPLGHYFLTHPGAFLVRAGQLTPGAAERDLLLLGIRRAIEMIFINGEPYDRFNIPDRPIFGPLLGAFFVIGLLATIRRALFPSRPRSGDPSRPGPFAPPPSAPSPALPPGRAADVLLLVWLPAFLLPTALSVHDIFPSNVRAFGEWPLLALFPARGIVAAAGWLAPGLTRPARRPLRPLSSFPPASFPPASFLLPPSFFFILIAAAIATFHSYFGVWAHLPDQYLNNEGDLSHAARWLNAQNTAGSEIYISAYHYRHPALAYLARDFSRMRFVYQGGVLPVPQGASALYLFPRSAPLPDEWLAGWAGHLIAAEPGPDGRPDFYAYRFGPDEATPLPDFQPAAANFANMLALQGWRLASVSGGGPAVVDLLWQVLNPPEAGDLRFVADLVDPWGQHWTQAFNDAYPSEQWVAGDRLLARLAFDLPPGLPRGDYRLAVTVYSPSTRTNLPALNPDGSAAAYGFVGPISVPPTLTGGAGQGERGALIAGPLRLLGFDPPPASARPGDPLPLALYLTTPSAAPDVDLTLRLTGAAAPGGARVLESGAPVRGSYPTSRWAPGEYLIDRRAPRLPRDLPPGDYALEVALPGGVQTLGPVRVLPLERVMVAPAFARPADVVFGDTIALPGFSLDPDPPLPGRPFTLTLTWRALAATDADYTAFVHVLNPDGSIAAQRDSRPRDGGYPTYLWLPGEYVTDTYTVTLNSGQYTLEAGFYLPDTGARLGGGGFYVLVVP